MTGDSGMPSRAAQKLVVLGILAWSANAEVPRSRRAHARRHFNVIIAKAQSFGFRESVRLKAGLRAGRATPAVIARAETVCSLVSEVTIDAELRAAAEHERLVGVFGAPRRTMREST